MHPAGEWSENVWPPPTLVREDVVPPASSAPKPPEASPREPGDGITHPVNQVDDQGIVGDGLLHDTSNPSPTGLTSPARDSLALINLLTGLIEYRDPYFRGASGFTRHLAASIGHHMGLPEDALICLAYAALLRDVGRMTLNGLLIPATAKVSSDDRYRIERHVSLGLELLQGIELPSGVKEAIRHHHEQWNGSGYPDGLRGEEIPILSRIIGVAESFAAMISARPYRPPKRFDEAVREIQEGSGRLYDPAVVDALIAVIASHEYRIAGFGLHDYILIVHSDRPRAAQLAIELCSRGYLPEVALDVASARARLPGIPVGAILVSGLSEGDSALFVEHVRGIPRYRDIPVLAFDLSTAEDRIAMLRAGANGSFSDDCHLDELLETLGAALGRTRVVPERVSDALDPSLPWGAVAAENGVARPSGSNLSGLQGNLSDFPLSWLLQTMQYDGRGAVVSVHSDAGSGSITLHHGILYHAVTDRLAGEAAFNEILDWTEGVFRVQPSTVPGPRTIERSMMHLMLEHAARSDEQHALFGAVTTV